MRKYVFSPLKLPMIPEREVFPGNWNESLNKNNESESSATVTIGEDSKSAFRDRT